METCWRYHWFITLVSFWPRSNKDLERTLNYTQSDTTNKIEMVQRRCVRYVIGIFDCTTSVTSLLKSPNWPTLEEKRCQNCLAVTHCILHNIGSLFGYSLAVLLTQISSCTRGHSCRLFVPFCKNHVYASFFPRTSNHRYKLLPSIQLMHNPLTPLRGSLYILLFVSSSHPANSVLRLSSDF